MSKEIRVKIPLRAVGILILLAISFIAPTIPQVKANPATVGTSTTRDAVAYGSQRKGFNAEGLFWAFYSDGTNAGWEFSNDGITWDGAFTSIGSCTLLDSFSIWFDGTYVHYALGDWSVTQDLYYRRGIPENDGSITWSAVEQIVYDGETGDKYMFPCITVDTNGYAWIGAHKDDLAPFNRPFVLKNANNDGTWATDFAYELNAVIHLSWKVCPVPLTGGKIYVIYCRNNQPPLGKLYDAGWGAEENDLADYDIDSSESLSAVAYGDDVHFVYTRDVTWQIRHNERVWGVGWNAADVLVQDTVTPVCGPVLSANPSTGDLYCFWTSTVTDHVYYKQYTGGVWGGLVDWIDESTDEIYLDDLISSFYMDYGGYIGVLYVTKLASPFNVRFASLTPRVYTRTYESCQSSTYTETITEESTTTTITETSSCATITTTISETTTSCTTEVTSVATTSTAYSDWLDGWGYRKSHNITGSSGGAQTNYVVKIKVYFGAGVDGTEAYMGDTIGKVYCDSTCQVDFDDIRLTTSDGNTLIDHWLKEKVNSDYAIFEVEVPSIPADPDDALIFIYWGNVGAASASNIYNTYGVYIGDDFEECDLGRWDDDDVAPGVSDCSDTIVFERTYAWRGYDGSAAGGIAQSSATITGTSYLAAEVAVRVGTVQATEKNTVQLFLNLGAANRMRVRAQYVKDNDEVQVEYYTGATWADIETSLDEDTWYQLKIYWKDTTFDVYVYDAAGSLLDSGIGLTGDGTGNVDDVLLRQSCTTDGSGYGYQDIARVRKYVSPEPGHGVWGAEETSGTATSCTTMTVCETTTSCSTTTTVVTTSPYTDTSVSTSTSESTETDTETSTTTAITHWTVIQIIIDPLTTITLTSETATSYTTTTTCDTSTYSSTSSTTTCDTSVYSSTSSTTTCDTLVISSTSTSCITTTVTHTTECSTTCETSTFTSVTTTITTTCTSSCTTTCITSTFDSYTTTTVVHTVVYDACVIDEFFDEALIAVQDDMHILPQNAHLGDDIFPSNTTDLVGRWGFNEGSGTNATDTSNNGNHGVITGATYIQGIDYHPPDFLRYALRFDDTAGDYVNVTYNAVFDQAVPYSIELWFRPGTQTNATGTLVYQGSRYWIYYDDATSSLIMAFDDGGWKTLSSTGGLTTGYTHCVFMYQDAPPNKCNMTMFFNATLRATNALVGTPPAGSTHLLFGRDTGINSFLSGDLDVVRYYNRTISRADILENSIILHRDGYMYSENMLEDLNVTQIVNFKYDSCLATGDHIYVQFSQDNSTWVDSDGTAAWEELNDGSHSILLTGLDWAGNFFYRANFVREDGVQVSPQLEMVAVCYSTIPVGAGGWNFIIVVALVFVMLGIGMMGLVKRR